MNGRLWWHKNKEEERAIGVEKKMAESSIQWMLPLCEADKVAELRE